MKNKNTLITIILAILALSFVIVFFAPKMHKPFQISIIEYIIKINSDNSMTTTKKTTDYTYVKGEEK